MIYILPFNSPSGSISDAKYGVGSHAMELAMRLVQLMISKLPGETVYVEHPHELSKMVIAFCQSFSQCMTYDRQLGWNYLLLIVIYFSLIWALLSWCFQVTTIAKQFAVLHSALKFEALHLLSNILSSNYSVCKFFIPP